MSTFISTAATDEAAKDIVSSYKTDGLKNIALIGPDTKLSKGPVFEEAKWIIIASNEAITLGKTDETTEKDEAEKVIKEGKQKEGN